MIRLPTQKLSAGDNSYIRPVKTITESLSKEDIEEQLEGYVEIEGDDLNFINSGYFFSFPYCIFYISLVYHFSHWDALDIDTIS